MEARERRGQWRAKNKYKNGTIEICDPVLPNPIVLFLFRVLMCKRSRFVSHIVCCSICCELTELLTRFASLSSLEIDKKKKIELK